MPAVGEMPCFSCDLLQNLRNDNGDGVERPCQRCSQTINKDIEMLNQPSTLQYLCGTSLASGRINFFHGNFLPNRLKNQLSEQVTELNLCGHCSNVKQIGESGFKIFTFKNPYLGNTCVPFIHWACSYKCAQAIEVPARKEQLSSAKEQVDTTKNSEYNISNINNRIYPASNNHIIICFDLRYRIVSIIIM